MRSETAIEVKERPIIFSGEMVRAILAGKKSATRRVVKPQPIYVFGMSSPGHVLLGDAKTHQFCPYGMPGDRLWVRETWIECLHTSPATDEPMELSNGDKLIEPATSYTDCHGRNRWRYDGRVICYRATSNVEFCDGDGFSGDMANRDDMPRWKSPIHMPRWASRLTLEITDVRVERVQDITEAEAIDEGALELPNRPTYAAECEAAKAAGNVKPPLGDSPRQRFARKWDTLNAKRGFSWDSNPWVWAITFKVV